MTETEMRVAQFDRAMLLLPQEIRGAYRELSFEERARCEEIRLRTGEVPTALLLSKEKELCFRRLSQRDVEATLTIATNASFHTVKDSLKRGFLTVAGGFRIGIGGHALIQGGELNGFRAVSSLCIRIPRQIAVADPVLLCRLFPGGTLCSVLIISPPGMGKTTLLRDLVRLQSNLGHRVSVVDERSEIAAMVDGQPQMDVGKRTDILDGCRKAEGALIMLKAMNPEIIAMDEITDPADVAAVQCITRCGAAVFATVHGEKEASDSAVVADLQKRRLFQRAVYIEKNGDQRKYTIVNWEAEKC